MDNHILHLADIRNLGKMAIVITLVGDHIHYMWPDVEYVTTYLTGPKDSKRRKFSVYKLEV